MEVNDLERKAALRHEADEFAPERGSVVADIVSELQYKCLREGARVESVHLIDCADEEEVKRFPRRTVDKDSDTADRYVEGVKLELGAGSAQGVSQNYPDNVLRRLGQALAGALRRLQKECQFRLSSFHLVRFPKWTADSGKAISSDAARVSVTFGQTDVQGKKTRKPSRFRAENSTSRKLPAEVDDVENGPNSVAHGSTLQVSSTSLDTKLLDAASSGPAAESDAKSGEGGDDTPMVVDLEEAPTPEASRDMLRRGVENAETESAGPLTHDGSVRHSARPSRENASRDSKHLDNAPVRPPSKDSVERPDTPTTRSPSTSDTVEEPRVQPATAPSSERLQQRNTRAVKETPSASVFSRDRESARPSHDDSIGKGDTSSSGKAARDAVQMHGPKTPRVASKNDQEELVGTSISRSPEGSPEDRDGKTARTASVEGFDKRTLSSDGLQKCDLGSEKPDVNVQKQNVGLEKRKFSNSAQDSSPSGTAAHLKTQGVETEKQGVSSMGHDPQRSGPMSQDAEKKSPGKNYTKEGGPKALVSARKATKTNDELETRVSTDPRVGLSTTGTERTPRPTRSAFVPLKRPRSEIVRTDRESLPAVSVENAKRRRLSHPPTDRIEPRNETVVPETSLGSSTGGAQVSNGMPQESSKKISRTRAEDSVQTESRDETKTRANDGMGREDPHCERDVVKRSTRDDFRTPTKSVVDGPCTVTPPRPKAHEQRASAPGRMSRFEASPQTPAKAAQVGTLATTELSTEQVPYRTIHLVGIDWPGFLEWCQRLCIRRSASSFRHLSKTDTVSEATSGDPFNECRTYKEYISARNDDFITLHMRGGFQGFVPRAYRSDPISFGSYNRGHSPLSKATIFPASAECEGKFGTRNTPQDICVLNHVVEQIVELAIGSKVRRSGPWESVLIRMGSSSSEFYVSSRPGNKRTGCHGFRIYTPLRGSITLRVARRTIWVTKIPFLTELHDELAQCIILEPGDVLMVPVDVAVQIRGPNLDNHTVVTAHFDVVTRLGGLDTMEEAELLIVQATGYISHSRLRAIDPELLRAQQNSQRALLDMRGVPRKPEFFVPSDGDRVPPEILTTNGFVDSRRLSAAMRPGSRKSSRASSPMKKAAAQDSQDSQDSTASAPSHPPAALSVSSEPSRPQSGPPAKASPKKDDESAALTSRPASSEQGQTALPRGQIDSRNEDPVKERKRSTAQLAPKKATEKAQPGSSPGDSQAAARPSTLDSAVQTDPKHDKGVVRRARASPSLSSGDPVRSKSSTTAREPERKMDRGPALAKVHENDHNAGKNFGVRDDARETALDPESRQVRKRNPVPFTRATVGEEWQSENVSADTEASARPQINAVGSVTSDPTPLQRNSPITHTDLGASQPKQVENEVRPRRSRRFNPRDIVSQIVSTRAEEPQQSQNMKAAEPAKRTIEPPRQAVPDDSRASTAKPVANTERSSFAPLGRRDHSTDPSTVEHGSRAPSASNASPVRRRSEQAKPVGDKQVAVRGATEPADSETIGPGRTDAMDVDTSTDLELGNTAQLAGDSPPAPRVTKGATAAEVAVRRVTSLDPSDAEDRSAAPARYSVERPDSRKLAAPPDRTSHGAGDPSLLSKGAAAGRDSASEPVQSAQMKGASGPDDPNVQGDRILPTTPGNVESGPPVEQMRDRFARHSVRASRSSDAPVDLHLRRRSRCKRPSSIDLSSRVLAETGEGRLAAPIHPDSRDEVDASFDVESEPSSSIPGPTHAAAGAAASSASGPGGRGTADRPTEGSRGLGHGEEDGLEPGNDQASGRGRERDHQCEERSPRKPGASIDYPRPVDPSEINLHAADPLHSGRSGSKSHNEGARSPLLDTNRRRDRARDSEDREKEATGSTPDEPDEIEKTRGRSMASASSPTRESVRPVAAAPDTARKSTRLLRSRFTNPGVVPNAAIVPSRDTEQNGSQERSLAKPPTSAPSAPGMSLRSREGGATASARGTPPSAAAAPDQPVVSVIDVDSDSEVEVIEVDPPRSTRRVRDKTKRRRAF